MEGEREGGRGKEGKDVWKEEEREGWREGREGERE